MSFFRVQKKNTNAKSSESPINNSKDFSSTNKIKEENTRNSSLDTTFVLNQINVPSLDRNYIMSEIGRLGNKIQTNQVKTKSTEPVASNLQTNLITRLANAGISDNVKEAALTLIYKDNKLDMYTTFNDYNKIKLKSGLKYHCWHCRHTIPEDLFPVSIPIKFYPSYIESMILDNRKINQINKLEFGLNETIPLENLESEKTEKVFYDKKYLTIKEREAYEADPRNDKSRLKVQEYFDGEGVFCSFNCMMGYQYEHQCKNIKYKDSPALINLLYYSVFKKYPDGIIRASSWRTLKEYGGDQSIEEFRKNFSYLTYDYIDQYVKRICGPVKELFIEESS